MMHERGSGPRDASPGRPDAAGVHPPECPACVEARNKGVAVEKEGKTILTEAAKHSPELKIAMETWKEIKFEFDTVDKLDIANK